MTVTFPEIRVGQPVQHEALSVFPLFQPSGKTVLYLLASEAIALRVLTVQEVNDAGSVPELLVENTSQLPVLFLEGEQLVGAKQNRVLNTSLLVGAYSTVRIPVSCVEQGRWNYRSRTFAPGGTHSPSKLRRHLKESVERSLREGQGHRSDQRQVWAELARQQRALKAESDTGAMADTFAAYQDRVRACQEKMTYVEGAFGFAVAMAGKFVLCDLFDKPSTCQKLWSRLLSGVILDSIEIGSNDCRIEVAEVERTLAAWLACPWQRTASPGIGQEWRVSIDKLGHASALLLDEVLIHGSLISPA